MDKSLLTDEYVSSVLKDEARDGSLKYSTLGLDAFRSSRNAGPSRKPNTRFLSHLLRDTDAHNAALRAKEQHEAKQRRQAQREQGDYVQSSREDKFGLRHDNVERPHKRRRTDGRQDEENSARRSRSRSRSPRHSDSRRRHRRSRSRDSRRRRHRHSSEEEDDGRSRHSHRRHERRDGRHEKDRRRDRTRDRDKSDGTKRSEGIQVSGRAVSTGREHNPRAPTGKNPREERNSPGRRRRSLSDSSQSDPLEAIVGPAPPPQVKVRGRGAHAASSNMDARFDPHYNPKEDVRAESGEEDDWEMALEALRDRQKWKQQGADRLRAAGFTDSQIDQWSRSGGERDESDVRWAKEGQGREWDRGKVVGDDDEIELRPSWARPRNT